MSYRLGQGSRPVAAVPIVLSCMAFAAQAQRLPEAAEFMQDPKFKPLYFKALGPKASTPWLAGMDGPAPPTRKIQIDGSDYLLSAFCKSRECNDHSAVLLYSAPKGEVYGVIYEKGRTTLIGGPPDGVGAELSKLWKTQWRPQAK
jgi:Inhibitor of vertebrate lysozyme (Ivy)